MDEMTAEYYTGLLDCLKAKMTSPRFMTEHRRSVTDFSRKRCLTFVIVWIRWPNVGSCLLPQHLSHPSVI